MVKQRQKQKASESPYKKLDKDKETDSDAEETELFVKNRPARREILTIEKNVEEDDTLQSLAIRYYCTTEDLKRLNHIHKDNEIFAKRTIKVPHRPFTMALAGIHISGKSSPGDNTETSTSKLIDMDFLNTKLSSKMSDTGMKHDEVNEIIFNSNIAQKPSEVLCDEMAADVSSEEAYLLGPRDKIGESEATVTTLNFNGADCDIPWVALIICIVIVIVAVPLIYVFYIAEHPEQYHHHIS